MAANYAKLRDVNTLRSFMEKEKFSTSRLARYSGCSRSFIGHLMTGYRNTCNPQLAKRIEEALGIPQGVLFDPKCTPTGGRA